MNHKNKIITIGISLFAVATLAIAYYNLTQPNLLFSTSNISIEFETAESIVASSDLIIKVEVLDDLCDENSVVSHDFYSFQSVRILDLIKGNERVNSIINIIEPIAMKKNTIYEFNIYPFETSLKNGQVVTLFFEKTSKGDYAIKQAGNAQINSTVKNNYSDLLDIYLNADSELAKRIGTLVPNLFTL